MLVEVLLEVIVEYKCVVNIIELVICNIEVKEGE